MFLWVKTYCQPSMPVAGDIFYFQTDKSPNNKKSPAKGKVKFWDYSYLQSPFITKYKVQSISKKEFSPERANIVMVTAEGEKHFYIVGKKDLSLIGQSSDDPFGFGYRSNISFTNSFKENLSSMKINQVKTEVSETYIEYGLDNIRDFFLKKLPLMPDSIRLNVLITRRNRVDGTGKLFLPDITLNECIRITREETYDYTVDTKVGNYRWSDATELFKDNLAMLPVQNTKVLFYNNKYLLPVLILNMDNSQNVNTADYMVPAKIALLRDKPSGQPSITLYPNPAYTKDIKLEFANIPAGRYTFKMYSLIGNLEKSIPYYINNSKFDTIDISDLKPGIYIYALVDGLGKIIQSKRLTIISP